jgi:hypothetical protein
MNAEFVREGVVVGSGVSAHRIGAVFAVNPLARLGTRVDRRAFVSACRPRREAKAKGIRACSRSVGTLGVLNRGRA